MNYVNDDDDGGGGGGGDDDDDDDDDDDGTSSPSSVVDNCDYQECFGKELSLLSLRVAVPSEERKTYY